MKLELKHLAAYLPHKLKIQYQTGIIYEFIGPEEYGIQMISKDGQLKTCGIRTFKPILRPLSDLTKEIEVNGKKFVPQDEFSILYGGGVPHVGRKLWLEIFIDNIKYSPIDTISFGVVEKLLEWHFDIYGLIENNLAIDVNTLNQIK